MSPRREYVAAAILVSGDPAVYRAVCSLCPWASHPAGAPKDVVEVAAKAHVEAVHNGRYVRTVKPGTGG